jgi:RNA polymerase sigma-70 factor (ECF subfamily)
MTEGGEQALLEAGRAGDEAAFQRLLEPRLADLRRHCLRMLGSVEDAEDATQEVMLRAWRALPRFEGRSSVRSWLYTIATNTCLNAIAKRPHRIVPVDYRAGDHPHPSGERAETLHPEPYDDDLPGMEQVGPRTPDADYEAREAAELALTATLEQLPPAQHKALILRDVLGYSAQEAAMLLSTTVAAVNSALQRARSTTRDELASPDRAPRRRVAGRGEERRAAVRYLNAIERGDVEGLVGMLAASPAC